MALTFSIPWLLGGLALVVVPVIIHLFLRQKPRHLYFPAFRFLQQRHLKNMRRLRLRHLLLLALRMALIAFLCLALAQPQGTLGQGFLPQNSPCALVLVMDTSASMGYEVQSQTRLMDAQERALQVVRALPAGSRVAVVDSSSPGSQFVSREEAANLLSRLKIRDHNRPVTAALEEALRLLERERPALPVTVTVFSDRTTASWDSQLAKELPKLEQRAEQAMGRPITLCYYDLGVPAPRNVRILGISLQTGAESSVPLEDLTFGVSNGHLARLQARIEVTGTTVDTEVTLKVDGEVRDTKRLSISAAPGESAIEVISFVPFEITRDAHQGEVAIQGKDPLEADNVRYWTLHSSRRQVLVVTARREDALLVRTALETLAALPVRCEVVVLDSGDAKLANQTQDLARKLSPDVYQAVFLLNVPQPSEELWQLVHSYLSRGGGVLIAPGADCNPAAYTTPSALEVMPAKLVQMVDGPEQGLLWAPTDYAHPITERVRAWERQDLSYWRAWRFWQIAPLEGQTRSVVPFHVPPHAAVLERLFDVQKIPGRSLLVTTALYRRVADPSWKEWNNYHEGWFFQALVYLCTRYLVGAREERCNFRVDTPPRFWVPESAGFSSYLLEGPVPATGDLPPKQPHLVLSHALPPGNYTLSDPSGKLWQRRFSVNLTEQETELVRDRPDKDTLQTLFAADMIREAGTVQEDVAFLLGLAGQGARVDFLPYLMALLLLALAGENMLANRFYRAEPTAGAQAAETSRTS
ncbi:MAG: hypothetical protein C4297_07480 [Gemmataceae bacterium]